MVRRIGAAAAAVIAALAIAALAGLGSAAPAEAGAGTAALRANEQLGAGQRLVTPNGIALVMQADGKLVELAPGDRAVWWITTNRPGTVLRMQADGNLALVIPGGVTIWSTRTGGNPGATLELGQDGAAIVYSAARVPLWNNGARVNVPTTPTTAPTTAPPTT